MTGSDVRLTERTARNLWLYVRLDVAAPHMQKIPGCICSAAGAASLNHALRFGLTTSSATYTSL